MSNIDLYQGDCLEVMKQIPDKSIDMILCDLPYGTTQCKWDVIIPFDKLWEQYNRVSKETTPIVLFGSQPFTSLLILSKLENYKYNWTWNKVNKGGGFLNAKKQPLRIVEDVVVFYKQQCIYNPQFEKGKPYKSASTISKSDNFGKHKGMSTVNDGSKYYPKNLLSIKGDERGKYGRSHPTQKPIEILEYLIKTYTHEDMTVLDNTMGSGSTGVACINTNRNFIGIEKDEKYFKIAEDRIKDVFELKEE